MLPAGSPLPINDKAPVLINSPGAEFTIIRGSSLPTFADCPRRWASNILFQEVEALVGFKLRETANTVGSSVGTSTHEGAAYSLIEKMKSGEIGNGDEAVQRSLDKFKSMSKEGISYANTTPNYNKAEQQIAKLVYAYRTQVAPRIQPMDVEIRLETDILDGFKLSGQLDAREISTIRDLKTGVMRRANISQYGSYVLLVYSHFKELIGSIVEDFLPRSQKPSSPEFYYYDVRVAMMSAMSILKRIKSSVQEFRATAEPSTFIANPQSMLCSERYCSAWGTKFCQEHKQPDAKE